MCNKYQYVYKCELCKSRDVEFFENIFPLKTFVISRLEYVCDLLIPMSKQISHIDNNVIPLRKWIKRRT